MCFAFQPVSAAALGFLRGLVGNILAAVQTWSDVLYSVFVILDCPYLMMI